MSEREGYPVTYLLQRHDPPMPIEEVRARGLGGCDNLVFVSIIGTPGAKEQLSTMTMTVAGNEPLQEDGRWAELTPQQRWQIWTIMADGLAEQLGDDPRALLCRLVKEWTRGAVLMRRLTPEKVAETQRLLDEATRIMLSEPENDA